MAPDMMNVEDCTFGHFGHCSWPNRNLNIKLNGGGGILEALSLLRQFGTPLCIDSPEAESQKMHQTRFRLPHQVANVSWFYLTGTPITTIIWVSVQLFRWEKCIRTICNSFKVLYVFFCDDKKPDKVDHKEHEQVSKMRFSDQFS